VHDALRTALCAYDVSRDMRVDTVISKSDGISEEQACTQIHGDSLDKQDMVARPYLPFVI